VIQANVRQWAGIEADEELPAYAWPGGYQITYITSDGATVCPECANDEDVSDDIVAGDVFYEGPAEQCAGCNRMIESSYGDPDEDDNARAPDARTLRVRALVSQLRRDSRS
jgi:hypothetical protein